MKAGESVCWDMQKTEVSQGPETHKKICSKKDLPGVASSWCSSRRSGGEFDKFSWALYEIWQETD